jgi:hypothetical protein
MITQLFLSCPTRLRFAAHFIQTSIAQSDNESDSKMRYSIQTRVTLNQGSIDIPIDRRLAQLDECLIGPRKASTPQKVSRTQRRRMRGLQRKTRSHHKIDPLTLIIRCLRLSTIDAFFCANAPHKRKTTPSHSRLTSRITESVNVCQPIALCEFALCALNQGQIGVSTRKSR